MSNLENPYRSPSESNTSVSSRPLSGRLWLAYFCSLGLVVVAAASISHLYLHGYPTGTLLDSILFYPVAFFFLALMPNAWPLFLPLPVLTVVLAIVGFKRQSRTILALSLSAAFAASVVHSFWIEAMMGC